MAFTIEDMATFCKKKGFVYPNSEIYGGLAGFFDFAHLGVETKNNIKRSLWKTFVNSREDVVGIDGSLINSQKVWEASGHVACFADIMLECSKCGNKVRADQYLEEELNINAEGINADGINELVTNNNIKCPRCSSDFKKASDFNLMFKTYVGPTQELSNIAYLRPETAQLIFTNFKLVFDSARFKLPCGIAQTGKAFRNEISPRDFLFRSREFEQFEIEYFAHPDKINESPYFKDVKDLKLNILTADMQEKKQEHKKMKIQDLVTKNLASQWHAYWLAQFHNWFTDMGINPDNLRLREHKQDELAHYAGACFDIEYKFPFGWKEIHGNADRKQFDLQQHIEHSKKDLTIFDEESKKKLIPHVAAEPSQGVERAFLAFMFDAYNDDKKRGNVVLKLHPHLAPIKVAVFPLVNKLNKEAKEVYDIVKKHFNAVFDKGGSVGRRYARNDEIGTPYCVTIDFESLKDKSITIRDRDTTKQIRVKIKDLPEVLYKLIYCNAKFEECGKLI